MALKSVQRAWLGKLVAVPMSQLPFILREVLNMAAAFSPQLFRLSAHRATICS
ncbi:hypothetical protein [Brachybacterium sp. FME24]|uniref:hypothetical protein n=1 Tax=Brachybacterium sp. FME24 TaxID=2742605 RepID=UPI0018691C9E|nr:hypothetical protein [Brachybacterium sp. FME24]